METVTSPKRKAKFVAGGGALFLVFIGLIVWATTRQGATSFYMSTSELAAAAPAAGESYRVNGEVVPGSIETSGLSTTFTLTDGSTQMVITTDRPLPDTFRERSDVVARGSFDGDLFVADEVLAKCPSKFKAKA